MSLIISEPWDWQCQLRDEEICRASRVTSSTTGCRLAHEETTMLVSYSASNSVQPGVFVRRELFGCNWLYLIITDYWWYCVPWKAILNFTAWIHSSLSCHAFYNRPFKWQLKTFSSNFQHCFQDSVLKIEVFSLFFLIWKWIDCAVNAVMLQ